ncbi:hypothetical protein CYMTET_5508 [Cymbomonas tetramitiformis]|uniref:ER membrane protein complex subunit 6 n=1 Tax=Cymbomonas tetramitiformis TaxID=36881 RepID=A0AAE0GYZ1_9CHLO|nr:hypothetical protein CYMTET_5508 [Cymbomonas tetramitiformis]
MRYYHKLYGNLTHVAAINQFTSVKRASPMVVSKGKDGKLERHFLSQENMQNNLKAVYFCRIFMSIVAGVVSGILGLTNIPGFIIYFLFMGLTSGGLVLKSFGSPAAYFHSWNKITFDGCTAGLTCYVLFWTLFYDIVHIYG